MFVLVKDFTYEAALCINNTVKTLICQASRLYSTSEGPGVADIIYIDYLAVGQNILVSTHTYDHSVFLTVVDHTVREKIIVDDHGLILLDG